MTAIECKGKLLLKGIVNFQRNWTTLEGAIQKLRKLAILEMIYTDLDNEQVPKDPDGEPSCSLRGRNLYRAQAKFTDIY